MQRESGYSRVNGQRRQRPIIIVGCEGETEKHYMTSLLRAYRLHAHFVICSDLANLAKQTLEKRKRLARRHSGRRIVTLLIGDIEKASDENINDAASVINTATSSGIDVVAVNFPQFERWILQHFERVPANASGTSIVARLHQVTMSLSLPHFIKPGSVHYFDAIKDRTMIARSNCQSSRHNDCALPCMCTIINLLESFS